MEKNITKIDSLSPLKTLSRGYSIAEKDGKILKSVTQVNKEDRIELKVTDGIVKTKVEEIIARK